MQEHIRRAHPEHYISKLPATEESFQLMISTPPSERPAPASSQPSEPPGKEGNYFDPGIVAYVSQLMAMIETQNPHKRDSGSQHPQDCWRIHTLLQPQLPWPWHSSITTDQTRIGTLILQVVSDVNGKKLVLTGSRSCRIQYPRMKPSADQECIPQSNFHPYTIT